MVRWSVPMLVAFASLTVAGCVGPGSDETASQDGAGPLPDPGQSADLNRTFSGKAELTVSQMNTPVNRVGFLGSNCIRFDEGDVERIHSLNATATWQAMTPAQQEIELRVHDGGGGHIVQGPSPLRVEASDLTPHEFFEGIFIMVQAPAPAGFTVDQQVQVEYTMVYDGDESPRPQPGGCSFG